MHGVSAWAVIAYRQLRVVYFTKMSKTKDGTCYYSRQLEFFVKATSILEGDGALALVAYEQISMLYSGISTEHYPNVYALAKSLSGGDNTREQ